MRVLVTGATGYVGGAVLRRLLAAGHVPVALTRRPDVAGHLPLPGPGAVAVEARAGDVLDPRSVRRAVRGMDAVVHLAALTRVRQAPGEDDPCRRVNVEGTAAVLDALAAEADSAGAPSRLVFASTAAVYGAARQRPIPESAPFAPLSPYAASKAAAEQLVGERCRRQPLRAVTLRIFNAAGAIDGHADRDPTRVVPRILDVAAGRAPRLEVYGDGRAVRDYVHVADVGDAVVASLAAGPAVYNVGAMPASVLELVAAAERVTGRPIAVVHRPGVPGEAPDLRADTSAIRAALGWRPSCSSLDELLASQWSVQR